MYKNLEDILDKESLEIDRQKLEQYAKDIANERSLCNQVDNYVEQYLEQNIAKVNITNMFLILQLKEDIKDIIKSY